METSVLYHKNPYNTDQTPFADIVCKWTSLPFGKYRYDFEWRGESNQAFITPYNAPGVFPKITWKIGAEFWLGHLHLVITDINHMSQILTVALADGRGFQLAYRRLLYNILDNLKCRIVLTLYVWGFAYLEDGQQITWKAIGRKRAT